MKIILNNNKSKLECTTKLLIKLRKHPYFCVRVPGAFYAPAFRRRAWDGTIKFITERGYIDTGKLPQLLEVLKEWDEPVKIIDDRFTIEPGKLKVNMEDGSSLRPYQKEAVRTVINNSLKNVPFPRGVIAAATNAGKTIIAASIFKTYNEPTVFMINSRELLDDALVEMPKFLGKNNVGWITQKEIRWAKFMVLMVPTAIRRPEISNKLAEYPVVLVDECDLASSKSYIKVLNWLYNGYVKIGLSGSAFVSRDKTKNERVRALFGDIIYDISNRELIDEGYSSDVKVYILKGNDLPGIKNQSYDDEYYSGITANEYRNSKIIRRIKYHVNRDRMPLLLMTRLHEHVEILYDLLERHAKVFGGELFGLKIDWVHHERKERKEIVKAFKAGKIDVLVGSHILKRGKNFPLMKVLVNASGGKSEAVVLQILGRATRIHESKKFTILDDFYDEGYYLRRHSKRRIGVYKKEKLRVIEKYK